MGRSLTFRGRLPGVVCESALPPQVEDPLRLDVTAFVGFTERGPLDIPVALHDVGQYHSVFGGDVQLARALQGNQIAYANMPGAVKAFFDNGGRRCYVVRVADQDQVDYNYFRIPGMLAWDGAAKAIRPVIAPAAWVGRWSEQMGVGTQLLSQPLRIADPIDKAVDWNSSDEVKILLELPTETAVRAKDMLRLRFGGPGKPLLFGYVTTDPMLQSSSLRGLAVHSIKVEVSLDRQTMQSFTQNVLPWPSLKSVGILKGDGCTAFAAQELALEELSGLADGYVLHMASTAVIKQSDVLCLDCVDGEALLFPVEMVAQQHGNTAAPAEQSSYTLTSRSPTWKLTPQRIERLSEGDWETVPVALATQKLEVRVGQNDRQFILHLNAEDAQRFSIGDVLRVSCINGSELLFPVADRVIPPPQSSQGSSPASPATAQPSAPSTAEDAQVISQEALWLFAPPAGPSAKDSYGTLRQVDLLTFNLYIRDGETIVETWSDLRFGDENSTDSWLNVLVPRPGQLRAEIAHRHVPQRDIPGLDPTSSAYLGTPKPVLGGDNQPIVPFYFPLCMEDLPRLDAFAGALGAKDGYQGGKDGLESFADPAHIFLDDRLAHIGYRDLLNEANAILNASIDVQVDSLLKLHSLLMIDEIGLVALPDLPQRLWPAGPMLVAAPQVTTQPRATSEEPDWSYFQACDQPVQAEPPPPVVKEPPPPDMLPIIETSDQYQLEELEALIAVQHALVNFCAARADVLGVLSLPLHFKRREVLDWQQRFTGLPEFLDGVPLSYVAVYHPWLQEPVDDGSLRSFPPEGAVCGMIAARELARGPWIAPANVHLGGVVGLATTFTAADWADLFNAQVNIVRQLPGQFTLMSAHTLSLENTFLHISVRRLLIFLRKLAVLRGMRYVFEANNERFRASVQTSFEATLMLLVDRGAITAFEVVTGSEINTQNDYDNGRFIIAIKVAPTLPIEFITVVLLRAGEGLLEAVEG